MPSHDHLVAGGGGWGEGREENDQTTNHKCFKLQINVEYISQMPIRLNCEASNRSDKFSNFYYLEILQRSKNDADIMLSTMQVIDTFMIQT
jgi:hypothetical protein